MFVYLYTGGKFSNGAKNLSKQMGIKRIKCYSESRFKPRPHKTVINWGSSTLPAAYSYLKKIYNHPSTIIPVVDKRLFFQRLSKTTVRIPEWTTDINEAKSWFDEEACDKILLRMVLTGHSGAGIIICSRKEDVPDNVPMYVKYVKKKQEYRVHCIRGIKDTFVQRKARVSNVEIPDWTIRNLKGGFIYANDPSNVGDVPKDVIKQAIAAFETIQLDFGAVDVIWNEHQQKAYVLEINTAPGLTGKTVEYYANGLKQLYESDNANAL